MLCVEYIVLLMKRTVVEMKIKFGNKKPLLILVGVFYVAYVLISQQIQFYKGNKTFNQNQKKIVQMEKENQELTKEKATYDSDENIEKIAREKLGYVKPGEKVYIDKEQ